MLQIGHIAVPGHIARSARGHRCGDIDVEVAIGSNQINLQIGIIAATHLCIAVDDRVDLRQLAGKEGLCRRHIATALWCGDREAHVPGTACIGIAVVDDHTRIAVCRPGKGSLYIGKACVAGYLKGIGTVGRDIGRGGAVEVDGGKVAVIEVAALHTEHEVGHYVWQYLYLHAVIRNTGEWLCAAAGAFGTEPYSIGARGGSAKSEGVLIAGRAKIGITGDACVEAVIHMPGIGDTPGIDPAKAQRFSHASDGIGSDRDSRDRRSHHRDELLFYYSTALVGLS